MQSFAKGLSRSRTRRQSGSVATLGALWLMVAVICLATIDIGNVFWQKRELQKIADLAALAGASGPLSTFCDSSGSAAARVNAASNGILAGEPFSAIVGKWAPSAVSSSSDGFIGTDKNSKDANACKVLLERNVPFFFVFYSSNISARNVKAAAIARQTPPLVKITVRSTLLSLNTDESILEPLINGLLGSSIKIDAVGWRGLANSDMDLLRYLDLLSTKLNLKLGDYQKLLNTDIGVGDLLGTMIDLLQQQGATASAQIDILSRLLVAVNANPVAVRLERLLNLGAGLSDAALKTSLNVLDFTSALVMLANSKNAAAANIGIDVGLAKVNVKTKIIEPPQTAVGNPAVDVVEAKTSQIDLKIITGINIGLVSLDVILNVGVGEGSAKSEDFSCASNNKYLNVNSSSGLLRLELGLSVKALGIPINVTVPLEFKKITTIKYDNPPRLDQPPSWKTIDFNFNIVSSLINEVLKVPVLGPVLSIILLPLTSLLDLIVGTVLNMLGINLSKVDVGVQLNCRYQADLVF